MAGPVDTSDIVSLDTKVVVEAIENQGTDDIAATIVAAINGATYTYGDADEELYQTNGFGGTDADVVGTELYTSDIDLTEERGATIDIEFDGDDATDDLIISLYARRDNDWDGDEIALSSVTVASDGSVDIYTLTITPAYGAGHYRIGMVRSGTTTTFEIEAQMRRWR